MTTDREFDALLRSWLGTSAPARQPEGLLESVISATTRTRPRPTWLVSLRGGPMPVPGTSRLYRSMPLALAATALVVVALVGIGLLVNSPSVGPSTVPGPTDSATPRPSATPKSGTWAATAPMNEARGYFSAVRLLNGKVLVAGGSTISGPMSASAELYDPVTGTWRVTGSMISPRAGLTAALLSDGKVLVAGGSTFSGPMSASAELYDPVTGTWRVTGSMISPRDGFTATLLSDGKVLVAGGWHDVGPILEPVASAELYDPASGTWAATGNMMEALAGHTATLLRDGRVLVAGGETTDGDGTIGVPSAELYDPITGTWTVTGSMMSPRDSFTATLLSDGKVLVAGGSNFVPMSASAELYDPVTGTWTVTGSMISPRYRFTATLLSDGNVLVAGGYGGPDGNVLLAYNAELYDPVSGTWTLTGGMITPRVGHTATLLQDGTVLIAGGSLGGPSGSDNMASAELYDLRSP